MDHPNELVYIFNWPHYFVLLVIRRLAMNSIIV